jgi:hypothetical protein
MYNIQGFFRVRSLLSTDATSWTNAERITGFTTIACIHWVVKPAFGSKRLWVNRLALGEIVRDMGKYFWVAEVLRWSICSPGRHADSSPIQILVIWIFNEERGRMMRQERGLLPSWHEIARYFSSFAGDDSRLPTCYWRHESATYQYLNHPRCGLVTSKSHPEPL